MNSFKRYFFVLLFLIVNFAILKSQGSAGDNASFETRFIVDMPTAGILEDKYYAINASVYPAGGLMMGIDFGFFKFVNAGISFSGNNIVGVGDIDWQNLPGVSVKARVFDERKTTPAVVLGFSSQGSSNYIGDNRFKTHSPGFYLSLSKNFKWDLGNLAIHGGLNYSLEPKSEYSSQNVYAGIEQSLGKYFALNIELNLQMDEAENQYYKKRGLLNTSLRASIVNGITAEIKFRDLLNHSKFASGHERIIALEIIKYLN
jgi:hypothetical protein